MPLAASRALAALLLALSLAVAPSAQTMHPDTGEPVPLGLAAPPAAVDLPAARGGDSLIPIQHLTAGTTKLVRAVPNEQFGELVVYQDGADLLLGLIAVPVGRDGGEPAFQEFDRVTLPGLPTDAVAVGDRLFVTLSKAPGLIEFAVRTLDGEDPTIEEVRRADVSSAFAVTVYGDRLYLGRGSAGVSILALEDLALLGGFDTPGSANGLAASVLDVGVLVLVVADGNVSAGDDVRIYDVTDAAAPTLLSSAETNGFATYAVVQNDATVFVAGAAGLTAISLLDGSVQGVIDAGGTTYEIAFDDPGDSVYYVNGLGGVRTIDVSDPANMAVLASNDFGGQGLSLALSDADLVLAADRFGGLRLLRNTDLGEEVRFPNGGFSNKPHFRGNDLYVTDLAGRLRSFDVSTPGAAVELDPFDVTSNTMEALTSGPLIFVSHSAGVTVLDASLAEYSVINLGQQANGMAVDGDVLYVANGFGGLVAVDVSDPFAPVVVSSTPLGSNVVDVAVDADADVAYVVSFGGGMLSFDVSDPAAPVQLDAEALGFLSAIDLDGVVDSQFAYVADGQAGLRIVDISDPAVLTSTQTFATASQARDVAVGYSGDADLTIPLAYVGDDFFGLREFEPETGAARSFASADRGIGVAARTDLLSTAPVLVALAAGEAGVYLFEAPFSVAGEPGAGDADLAVGTFPNPARGAASLTLTLPAASDVSVAVYDALGRRVARVERSLAAGPQAVALDTRAWAPGVYVARVRAGDAVATTRLTVVR